jgi:hypothetical protein
VQKICAVARHRLLLICSWDHRTSAIRDLLRASSIEAQIARVDTEPGLRAALKRQPYDAVVFVRDAHGIPLDIVRTQLLVQAPDTAVIVVDGIAEIGARVAPLLLKN